ncbi:hypothetical protein WJX81_005540 [Elliptochloris bilobata]|uniref:Uncharacterized protein n=1 Tax=Elliptochloris bilobata TaxID=381761 RepID=A0AAW1RC86_9CHLO
MSQHRFWAVLAPLARNSLAGASELTPAFATKYAQRRQAAVPNRTSASYSTTQEVPEEVKTPADRLAEGVASQYDNAAAAAATGEHTAAEHMAGRAEAAADKLEGRAGGTYQAQMEHAAAAFEDVAKGGASGGEGGSGPAPPPEEQETYAKRVTLADAASRVATQVAAGVRDGTANMMTNVQETVASVAQQAGGVVAKAKEPLGGVGQTPKVGQPADVEGPPSGVRYDAGPASAKAAEGPAESAVPPFTTQIPIGDRGKTEARPESQSSPFAEGVWQDGGCVFDVHPRGQGADAESSEQLRERARQDAERG